MNLNLRDAILTKMKDKTDNELQEVVESSIGGDDRTLPGLGVLFEVIWEHSGPTAKSTMIQTLKQHIK